MSFSIHDDDRVSTSIFTTLTPGFIPLIILYANPYFTTCSLDAFPMVSDMYMPTRIHSHPFLCHSPSLSTPISRCIYTSVFRKFAYSIICVDAFSPPFALRIRFFDRFCLIFLPLQVVLFSRVFVPRFDTFTRQVMQRYFSSSFRFSDGVWYCEEAQEAYHICLTVDPTSNVTRARYPSGECSGLSPLLCLRLFSSDLPKRPANNRRVM